MSISKVVSINKVTKMADVILLVLLGLNILTLFGLPKIMDIFIADEIFRNVDSITKSSILYNYALVVLYIAGVLAFIVLYNLRLMILSCYKEDPFVHENVKRLLTITKACIVIAFLFVTKIVLMNSFLTCIVVFVFIMAAIFSFVLALVFDKAV